MRSSVFTSIQATTDAQVALIASVDLLILNYHSNTAISMVLNASRSWMLYNQVDPLFILWNTIFLPTRPSQQDGRYFQGLYVYAAMQRGAQGHYLFAYSSPGGDPFYPLDARESQSPVF